ncbi:MAG: nuclear transport factor 2 family protein [bacterium]
MSTHQNIQAARAFLTALSGFDTDRVRDLLAADAKRIEWPNRLKPQGNHQTCAEMLTDAAKARAVLTRQDYAIAQIAASDTAVMVEFTWTGTLALEIGTLAAGDIMTAHCVAVFDFRDGKICGLRNYDCFDAF